MEWIHNNQELITVLAKILAAIIGCGLFVSFIYRFSIKYFESQGKDIARIKAFIWGPDGSPESGLEHRLTKLQTEHDIYKLDCGRRRKK